MLGKRPVNIEENVCEVTCEAETAHFPVRNKSLHHNSQEQE